MYGLMGSINYYDKDHKSLNKQTIINNYCPEMTIKIQYTIDSCCLTQNAICIIL